MGLNKTLSNCISNHCNAKSTDFTLWNFSTILCALMATNFSIILESKGQDFDIRTTERIHVEDIKTFKRQKPNVYPSYPAISLNDPSDILFISFDDLGEEEEDYYYELIHCTRDWKISDLQSSEYLRGFNQLMINNVDNSFNTAIPYRRYDFELPNDMMTPVISGNYLLRIFPENSPETPIITSRIIVYEEIIRYRSTVKESSVIRERTTSHEIDFDVVFNGYDIPRPYEDLHNTLLQNFNWHNAIDDLEPVFVMNSEVSYDYGEENTFKGNNEYRDFQMINLNAPSPQMSSLKFNTETLIPEIELHEQEPRPFKLYTTLRDLNGDFKINSVLGFDNDLESEYCEVLISLAMDYPYPATEQVHVYGGLTGYAISNTSKMTYNYTKKRYEAKLTLKQGYYNYLFGIWDGENIDFSRIEGAHFQTENDYHIITYDSNAGLGYDRIIGFMSTDSFNN